MLFDILDSIVLTYKFIIIYDHTISPIILPVSTEIAQSCPVLEVLLPNPIQATPADHLPIMANRREGHAGCHDASNIHQLLLAQPGSTQPCLGDDFLMPIPETEKLFSHVLHGIFGLILLEVITY